MDWYSFILFHTNKPRISNVIAKETCHISCITAIHHTAQLFVSSVLKLCFSRECRTSDHFISLHRISLHSLKTPWKWAETSWCHRQGSKSLINQPPLLLLCHCCARAASALLPLTQCQVQQRAALEPGIPQQRTQSSGMSIPRERSSFIL